MKAFTTPSTSRYGIGKPVLSALLLALVFGGSAALAGWSGFGGEWSHNGRLISQNRLDPSPAYCITDSAIFDDFRAEVEITLRDTPDHLMSAGLVFRWTDQKNWSAFCISAGGTVQFAQAVDGTVVRPIEGSCRCAILPGRMYKLRVEAQDNVVNCYLDGRLMVACRTERVQKGKLGFTSRDSQADFNRFDMRALAPDLHLTSLRDPLHPLGGKMTLPARPYGEVLAKVAEFAKSDRGKGGIPSNDGKPVPPYLLYAVIGADNAPAGEVSYPAFHHALFIEGFLNYYTYSGDEEFLRRAIELADWNIAHSTPVDSVYGNLPYSKMHWGESKDGGAIMVDKPALMGEMYVRLWEAASDLKYLSAATKIAETLKKTQLPDGRWSFRVKPQDGIVVEDYTSNAIFAMRLFDALEQRAGAADYRECKEKALLWLLQGPAKSGDWRGFYEGDASSVGNWDAIETARYLVERRTKNPAYLTAAGGIFQWVCDRFLAYKDDRGPGVLEQTTRMVPMQMHTGHWALLAAELGLALGDEAYIGGAVSALNLTTANLGDDGRGPVDVFATGGAPESWYCQSFSPLVYIPELMAALPVLAPTGEDHILRFAVQPRGVRYTAGNVEYSTARSSEEMLKLSFEPKSVTCNGEELKKDGVGRGTWKYDSERKLLTISHAAGRVSVKADAPASSA